MEDIIMQIPKYYLPIALFAFGVSLILLALSEIKKPEDRFESSKPWGM